MGHRDVCTICGNRGHSASSCSSPAATYLKEHPRPPPDPPPPPKREPDDPLVKAGLKMVQGWVRDERILNDGFAEMCHVLQDIAPRAYWRHFKNGAGGRTHCLIPGCEGGHYAKGYCKMHYGRWTRGSL